MHAVVGLISVSHCLEKTWCVRKLLSLYHSSDLALDKSCEPSAGLSGSVYNGLLLQSAERSKDAEFTGDVAGALPRTCFCFLSRKISNWITSLLFL